MDIATDNPVFLTLAPVLDLNAATALREEFLAARGTPLAVDASRVERLGAQCLQVLLAARKAWQAQECEFAVEGPSAAFIDAAALMGFDAGLLPAKETR